MTDTQARAAAEEWREIIEAYTDGKSGLSLKRYEVAVAQAVTVERTRLLDEFSDAIKTVGRSPTRQVYPFVGALTELLRREGSDAP